jgi:hypothetical protein
MYDIYGQPPPRGGCRDLIAGMLFGAILVIFILSRLGVMGVDSRPLVIRPVIDLRPTPVPTFTPEEKMTPEERREFWQEFLEMFPKEA